MRLEVAVTRQLAMAMSARFLASGAEKGLKISDVSLPVPEGDRGTDRRRETREPPEGSGRRRISVITACRSPGYYREESVWRNCEQEI